MGVLITILWYWGFNTDNYDNSSILIPKKREQCHKDNYGRLLLFSAQARPADLHILTLQPWQWVVLPRPLPRVQVRWDWQCKWGRHEHLATILRSSSTPSVGLWLWTIWARLGLVAARTKTEIWRSVGETATWFAKRWKCWRRGGTSLSVDCKSKRFGVDRCGGNIEQMTLKDRKQKISTANPMDSGSRNYRKENSERAGYPSFELRIEW